MHIYRLNIHFKIKTKQNKTKTYLPLSTGYLLVGLVVTITLKDTVLQVPRVCAVMRLFSGSQYAELEGVHLSEMTQSEDSTEEEPQYSQSICTISSTPLELLSPCSGLPADTDLHRARTSETYWPSQQDTKLFATHQLLIYTSEVFKCSNTQWSEFICALNVKLNCKTELFLMFIPHV